MGSNYLQFTLGNWLKFQKVCSTKKLSFVALICCKIRCTMKEAFAFCCCTCLVALSGKDCSDAVTLGVYERWHTCLCLIYRVSYKNAMFLHVRHD